MISLPSDLLKNIFESLPLRDLLVLKRVSKRTRTISLTCSIEPYFLNIIENDYYYLKRMTGRVTAIKLKEILHQLDKNNANLYKLVLLVHLTTRYILWWDFFSHEKWEYNPRFTIRFFYRFVKNVYRFEENLRNFEFFHRLDKMQLEERLNIQIKRITDRLKISNQNWFSLKQLKVFTIFSHCNDVHSRFYVAIAKFYGVSTHCRIQEGLQELTEVCMSEEAHSNYLYWLGMIYFKGMGIAEDRNLAATWFLRAAEKGNSNAQCFVGTLFASGNPLPKNAEVAVTWYRKSALQGNKEAQCLLGSCFASGRGVPQNDKEAVRLYMDSSQQGYAEAQYQLGICYFSGREVRKIEREGVMWMMQAAKQSHAEALYHLASCYNRGIGGVQNRAEEINCYLKSAEQGHREAQFQIARHYRDGTYILQNNVDAAIWFLRAAERGHAEAQYQIAMCYEDGKGVLKNKDEAEYWYSKAAQQNHPAALKHTKKISFLPF